jgi:omega-hydroxy-beta-dihydromenaquinone-9 sulfotransferase
MTSCLPRLVRPTTGSPPGDNHLPASVPRQQVLRSRPAGWTMPACHQGLRPEPLTDAFRFSGRSRAGTNRRVGGEISPSHNQMKPGLRFSLDAWRRLAAEVEAYEGRLRWRTRVRYGLRATGHSMLAKIQHMSHAHQLKSCLPVAPVFVLGFWRSGTTFLHELLCCDSQFGFPSTYACLNPFHFLLSESWIRQRPQPSARRPMDDMRYSWASPQEDEFALLALGAPSPYEALLAPSLLCDARSLLVLPERPVEDQQRWCACFEYFLRLLTVQQAKTMVLKSPPHGFRLPILRKLIPQARYILIDRNPYEVFASNLKLWRTLLDMYSLEGFSAELIEDFVFAAYVLHEQAIADGTRDLDRSFLACVRYEKLVAEPVAELRRLYQELHLGDFEKARGGVERHLGNVEGHTRNPFRLLPAQKQRVDEVWGDLIEAKGYRSTDVPQNC